MNDEPFYQVPMKWKPRRGCRGVYQAVAENARYEIHHERLDDRDRTLAWVTYKSGQRLRPVSSTLKLAKRRAETDRYWDNREVDEKEEKENEGNQ